MKDLAELYVKKSEGRIANFINGELYGRPANFLFGMIFPNADDQFRHPSQLLVSVQHVNLMLKLYQLQQLLLS